MVGFKIERSIYMKIFWSIVLFFFGGSNIFWGLLFTLVGGTAMTDEEPGVVVFTVVLGIISLIIGSLMVFFGTKLVKSYNRAKAEERKILQLKEEERIKERRAQKAAEREKQALRKELEARMWKCPYCGASTQGLKCEYCDSPYTEYNEN